MHGWDPRGWWLKPWVSQDTICAPAVGSLSNAINPTLLQKGLSPTLSSQLQVTLDKRYQGQSRGQKVKKNHVRFFFHPWTESSDFHYLCLPPVWRTVLISKTMWLEQNIGKSLTFWTWIFHLWYSFINVLQFGLNSVGRTRICGFVRARLCVCLKPLHTLFSHTSIYQQKASWLQWPQANTTGLSPCHVIASWWVTCPVWGFCA